MSFEDTQIDVLLRRHAERARSNSAIEHLDADELNAFAEGSLPVAARSRCVSHLADCDDCRRLVSQLAKPIGGSHHSRLDETHNATVMTAADWFRNWRSAPEQS